LSIEALHSYKQSHYIKIRFNNQPVVAMVNIGALYTSIGH